VLEYLTFKTNLNRDRIVRKPPKSNG